VIALTSGTPLSTRLFSTIGCAHFGQRIWIRRIKPSDERMDFCVLLDSFHFRTEEMWKGGTFLIFGFVCGFASTREILCAKVPEASLGVRRALQSHVHVTRFSLSTPWCACYIAYENPAQQTCCIHAGLRPLRLCHHTLTHTIMLLFPLTGTIAAGSLEHLCTISNWTWWHSGGTSPPACFCTS